MALAAHSVSRVLLDLPSRNDRDRVVAMQERRDVRTFLDGAETVNEGGRAADIDLDESQRGLRQLLPCMQSNNRNREGRADTAKKITQSG